MLILNWKLALLVMTVGAFHCVVDRLFPEQDPSLEPENPKDQFQLTGAYNEGILGAKTSKTLVIEDDNHQNFSKISDHMYPFQRGKQLV